MKLIDKLKNVFFEEVTEDDDEEELPQTFAKKIEIPKKKPEIFRQEKPVIEEEQEKTEEIVIPKEEKHAELSFPMMFDDDDFLLDEKTGELEAINAAFKEPIEVPATASNL